MTKNEVRTFADLIRYSQERAAKSLKRDDPIALVLLLSKDGAANWSKS